MKILYVTIIIIIVLCEIYLRYFNNINDTFDNNETLQGVKDINEPWDKIKKKSKYNVYYIKLNYFNDDNFIKWKNITKKIDYDIDNKYFIIKTNNEAEALAITNLYVCCLNNEMDTNEIVENDLISLSTHKAKTNKLVSTKLIELIKEGQSKINNTETFINDSIDTNNIINNIDEPSNLCKQNNIVEPSNLCKQNNIVEPSIIENKKPIQNEVDLTILNPEPFKNIIKIEPYGGNEFASIF